MFAANVQIQQAQIGMEQQEEKHISGFQRKNTKASAPLITLMDGMIIIITTSIYQVGQIKEKAFYCT